MGIFDKFLDNICASTPLTAELRWNHLNRQYEHELEREEAASHNIYDDWSERHKAEERELIARRKAGRREYYANMDFTLEFNEMYVKMLKKAKKLASADKDNYEVPTNVSATEIKKFLSAVEENLKSLLLNEDEFEFDYDYYELERIECNPSDYNDSGYESKSEAKSECRRSLKDAIQDVKDEYTSEKEYIISAIDSEMHSLKLNISSIKKTFITIVNKTANESICDEVTKEYIIKRFEEVSKQWEIDNKTIDKNIDKEYSERMTKTAKSYYKDEEADLSKQSELFELCDISERWRGDYKFNISGACRKLESEYSSILKNAVKELPAVLFKEYTNQKFERAAKLYKLIYMFK